MEDLFIPKITTIKANNLDELIIKAIKVIKKEGLIYKNRAGTCQQISCVNYVLLNSRNRIHWLRSPKSIKYLAKELLAYFNGSLDVNQGLAQASSFWKKLASDKNYIFSNYGYYVFHQKTLNYNSQYEWALNMLLKNPDTRRSMININQVFHKIDDSKDFPCAISVHFFIIKNTLNCCFYSRSSDVFFGLPYDIGFFSFVQELLYAHLKQLEPKKFKELKLGATIVNALFTQIYNFSRDQAENLLNQKIDKSIIEPMPIIDDAVLVLNDIYNFTSESKVMQWICNKSC